MIQYTEKGPALHEAIRKAGHSLREENGKWVASDAVAVQAIIDGFSVAGAAAPLVARIKDLARVKITAFLPEWKQSNCNARMNELNRLQFTRALTPEEEAEVAILWALWDRVKAIRKASDDHEARLAASPDFDSVAAYDITQGWPE